eukprot:3755940-Rhodomonas_salina.1
MPSVCIGRLGRAAPTVGNGRVTTSRRTAHSTTTIRSTSSGSSTGGGQGREAESVPARAPLETCRPLFMLARCNKEVQQGGAAGETLR